MRITTLCFAAAAAAAAASSSWTTMLGLQDQTTCTNGPCGPGNEMCGPLFDQTSPQYHIRDLSCAENDPNFPFFDARHGLTHHFFQSHLAEPQGGSGQGPVIGHAVSSDLVHWAHLPVAVWNDQPYDNVAIYTGSATIVDGSPVMIYPGLCRKDDWPACGTGTVFALAYPPASDPLLTNWSKPALSTYINPIVENVQRDPSTAWRTADGAEWRFTNYEGKIYSSADFVHWQPSSDGEAIFPTAECPDFFPLPALCVGNGCAANASGPLPTHVHKQSSSGQDWYTLGTYTDGPPGTAGTWTPVQGVDALQPLDFSSSGDGMHFYASKSYLDTSAGAGGDGAGRRIFYGWALVPPASTQTLARVTTYHAGMQRLLFSPLPELAALRASPPLYSSPPSGVALPAGGGTLWLGDWAPGAGNQSEVGATFVLPASGGRVVFGVGVVAGAPTATATATAARIGTTAGGAAANVSTPVYVSFDPSTFTANVTAGGLFGPGPNASYFMPGVDLPGDDYNVTDVSYTDPAICQAGCTADPKCAAYTYVVRPPLAGSCCFKGSVPAENPNPSCTSGVKPGHSPPPSNGGATATLPLLEGDTSVDIRVFVDNTFLEVFVMGGRLAFTVPLTAGSAAVAPTVAGVVLFSQGGAEPIAVESANVWHMGGIWVSADEVLADMEARKMRKQAGGE